MDRLVPWEITIQEWTDTDVAKWMKYLGLHKHVFKVYYKENLFCSLVRDKMRANQYSWNPIFKRRERSEYASQKEAYK